jgi:hypothetical protein
MTELVTTRRLILIMIGARCLFVLFFRGISCHTLLPVWRNTIRVLEIYEAILDDLTEKISVGLGGGVGGGGGISIINFKTMGHR